MVISQLPDHLKYLFAIGCVLGLWAYIKGADLILKFLSNYYDKQIAKAKELARQELKRKKEIRRKRKADLAARRKK